MKKTVNQILQMCKTLDKELEKSEVEIYRSLSDEDLFELTQRALCALPEEKWLNRSSVMRYGEILRGVYAIAYAKGMNDKTVAFKALLTAENKKELKA